jgi:hypothetical protein
MQMILGLDIVIQYNLDPRYLIQGWPRLKHKTLFEKQTKKAKSAKAMAQVVEHLSKVLSSIPSTAKMVTTKEKIEMILIVFFHSSTGAFVSTQEKFQTSTDVLFEK